MTSVLLVGGDPEFVGALRITLSANGFIVLTAPDGGTALRAATHDRLDVVVLDLDPPQPFARDLVTGLRDRGTAVVIGLTAPTDPDPASGADLHLTKPVDADTLLLRLRVAVHRAVAPAPLDRHRTTTRVLFR